VEHETRPRLKRAEEARRERNAVLPKEGFKLGGKPPPTPGKASGKKKGPGDSKKEASKGGGGDHANLTNQVAEEFEGGLDSIGTNKTVEETLSDGKKTQGNKKSPGWSAKDKQKRRGTLNPGEETHRPMRERGEEGDIRFSRPGRQRGPKAPESASKRIKEEEVRETLAGFAENLPKNRKRFSMQKGKLLGENTSFVGHQQTKGKGR